MSNTNPMAIEEVHDSAWKTKTLVVGALIGASVGALAAYLFVQRSEEGSPPEIGPGEGIKLGVLVFGLLRSIASIFEG